MRGEARPICFAQKTNLTTDKGKCLRQRANCPLRFPGDIYLSISVISANQWGVLFFES
jgi:hypothetical protein